MSEQQNPTPDEQPERSENEPSEDASQASELSDASFSEQSPPLPERERLADIRVSITHKFEIGGQTGYIMVGLYPDGRPGEVFLKIGKEGSTIGGLLDSIGILTSLALQHGVPIKSLSGKLSHVSFEPSGITKNPQLPMAKSVVDYVFRWLELSFGEPIPRDDKPEAKTDSEGPPNQDDPNVE